MKNQKWDVHTSSIVSTDANIIAMVAYISSAVLSFIPGVRYVAWVAPLVFFFIEKNSGFVKFHAMQAFVLNIFGAILGFLVAVSLGMGAFGPVSGISLLIGLVILIFGVMAIIKSYRWEEYHIPLVGKIAEKYSRRDTDITNTKY